MKLFDSSHFFLPEVFREKNLKGDGVGVGSSSTDGRISKKEKGKSQSFCLVSSFDGRIMVMELQTHLEEEEEEEVCCA